MYIIIVIIHVKDSLKPQEIILGMLNNWQRLSNSEIRHMYIMVTAFSLARSYVPKSNTQFLQNNNVVIVNYCSLS